MTAPQSPSIDRKTIWSWCLYDWANSAFTTLVVTFVYATYFTQTFAADENIGTQLWSRGRCWVTGGRSLTGHRYGEIGRRGRFARV